jgi:hypothetical protein
MSLSQEKGVGKKKNQHGKKKYADKYQPLSLAD